MKKPNLKQVSLHLSEKITNKFVEKMLIEIMVFQESIGCSDEDLRKHGEIKIKKPFLYESVFLNYSYYYDKKIIFCLKATIGSELQINFELSKY